MATASSNAEASTKPTQIVDIRISLLSKVLEQDIPIITYVHSFKSTLVIKNCATNLIQLIKPVNCVTIVMSKEVLTYNYSPKMLPFLVQEGIPELMINFITCANPAQLPTHTPSEGALFVLWVDSF